VSLALLKGQFHLSGDPHRIDELAQECSDHPISLVLAACYLTAFHGGNVGAWAVVPSPLPSPTEQTKGNRLRHQHQRQQSAFEGIVKQCLHSLESQQPLAAEVLKCLALYRLAPTLGDLVFFFAANDHEVSDVLKCAVKCDIQEALAYLSRLHLIELTSDILGEFRPELTASADVFPASTSPATEDSEPNQAYICIAPVRQWLPGQIPEERRKNWHRGIAAFYEKLALGEESDTSITLDFSELFQELDNATDPFEPSRRRVIAWRMRVREERVHHLLCAQQRHEAFDLYENDSIINSSFLGSVYGAIEVGERISRRFFDGRSPSLAIVIPQSGQQQWEELTVLNKWGAYLRDLGRLEDALA